MQSAEMRDPSEARRFLLQGLWWQRVSSPTLASVGTALAWALEIAAAGQPLPPIGVVADVGNLAFGVDWDGRRGSAQRIVPAAIANLLLTYEDHVLGKLLADWTFARAADALRRYRGRDRARGLAFLLNQFRERAGFAGVELSPGAIKAALDMPPEQVLAEGWDSIQRDGVEPRLVQLYERLVAAGRQAAEALGMEDIFELEHGTALADFGERIALRQVLRAAALLDAAVPRHAVRPATRQREAPTHLLDEDTYPVGGFTSIATRGSVESLLHSQLAYMEAAGERPDLFDVKFLRDELLYYSRDENQFLRRRRTFAFALEPDLTATRFKDAELPFQRGVLLLALLVVAVRRLSEWLSTEALLFEIVFLGDGPERPLGVERALLETVLREPIANGTVQLLDVPANDLAQHCAARASRSLCHCLLVGIEPSAFEQPDVSCAWLRVAGPRPILGLDDEMPLEMEALEAVDSWAQALEQLLRRWV